MQKFSGFPSGKTQLTPIPDLFFRELLPNIDSLAEIRVTLYIFWFLNQQQGESRYITRNDLLQDTKLMCSFGADPAQGETALDAALAAAVERGTILKAASEHDPRQPVFFFLNSARGRASVKAFENGRWSPDPNTHHLPSLDLERPTVFRLYEENIGPLTPLIAETLRDAEQTYPAEWIQDAIQIAVESNIRRWRYVEAILKSWQENGRHGTDRKDFEKNRDYYLKGDPAGFIER